MELRRGRLSPDPAARREERTVLNQAVVSESLSYGVDRRIGPGCPGACSVTLQTLVVAPRARSAPLPVRSAIEVFGWVAEARLPALASGAAHEPEHVLTGSSSACLRFDARALAYYVMEVAEFEEKQYEYGLTNEIAAGSTAVFPSGQMLEAILGYDIALDPGDPRIWALLKSEMPPGLRLTPSLWRRGAQPPLAKLPARLVSLVLQAKRPERLDHWRAGQNHRWRGPYYRFYVDTPQDQQQVLDHLERALPLERR